MRGSSTVSPFQNRIIVDPSQFAEPRGGLTSLRVLALRPSFGVYDATTEGPSKLRVSHIYISVCLSIDLSFHLSIYLSISIYLSTFICVYLSIYLAIYQPI